MNKRWDETEIPEHAYAQARDRAWTRLREKPRTARRNLALAALAALIGAAILVPFLKQTRPMLEPNILYKPKVIRPEVSTPGARVGSPVVARSAQKPIRKARARGKQTPLSERPDRVVLNFVLAESGVRMIWIMDKNFRLDGGIK